MLSVSVNGSSSITGAVQLIDAAGTRVALPDIPCRMVTVIALKSNTGRIYGGGVTVSSTVYGTDLGARDSFDYQVSNANMIYIDASVSGEGVSYVAI